jgi:hypothetical protein
MPTDKLSANVGGIVEELDLAKRKQLIHLALYNESPKASLLHHLTNGLRFTNILGVHCVSP